MEKLKAIQEQSERELQQKHTELQAKLVAAKNRVNVSEAERQAELDSIYKAHEEEARKKNEEVAMKLQLLKQEKIRENEIMLAKAKELKSLYEEEKDLELSRMVEERELLRAKADLVPSYTPKVGLEYFAEHDLLHLAGITPEQMSAWQAEYEANNNNNANANAAGSTANSNLKDSSGLNSISGLHGLMSASSNTGNTLGLPPSRGGGHSRASSIQIPRGH